MAQMEAFDWLLKKFLSGYLKMAAVSKLCKWPEKTGLNRFWRERGA